MWHHFLNWSIYLALTTWWDHKNLSETLSNRLETPYDFSNHLVMQYFSMCLSVELLYLGKAFNASINIYFNKLFLFSLISGLVLFLAALHWEIGSELVFPFLFFVFCFFVKSIFWYATVLLNRDGNLIVTGCCWEYMKCFVCSAHTVIVAVNVVFYANILLWRVFDGLNSQLICMFVARCVCVCVCVFTC